MCCEGERRWAAAKSWKLRLRRIIVGRPDTLFLAPLSLSGPSVPVLPLAVQPHTLRAASGLVEYCCGKGYFPYCHYYLDFYDSEGKERVARKGARPGKGKGEEG